MAIKDYNTDPDLNVQISGINIAEGCPPSGINNAIRQLMADVKVEQDVRDEEWATQSAKDAAQDAAIAEAKSSAEAAVSELSTELGALSTELGALGAQVGALETEVEGKADAEVGGKNVVRSVNGVSANAAGDVSDVAEIGDSYIRCTNGLQICWEYLETSSNSFTRSFPKPFYNHAGHVITFTANNKNITHQYHLSKSQSSFNWNITGDISAGASVGYIAIGRWK